MTQLNDDLLLFESESLYKSSWGILENFGADYHKFLVTIKNNIF